MNEIDPKALFRLSVLGPVVSRERLGRGELQQLIRELAQREYAIPGTRRVGTSARRPSRLGTTPGATRGHRRAGPQDPRRSRPVQDRRRRSRRRSWRPSGTTRAARSARSCACSRPPASWRARPVALGGAPAAAAKRSGRHRLSLADRMLPSPSREGARPSELHLSRWTLHFRYSPGDWHLPSRKVCQIGFRSSVSLQSAIQVTELLISAPAGLSPAEQASLRWTHSRTVGFPHSGSDLGFPSWAFPDSRRGLSTDLHTPRQTLVYPQARPRFERRRDLGSVSERRTGTAKCPEPLCHAGVTAVQETSSISSQTLLPLHRSYGLMRQTCCPPSASGSPRYGGSLQVAVSPCWAQALPDVISANLSLRVWTPTPAAPRVHLPVSSPRTLAFPAFEPGRRVAKSPNSYFCWAVHFGAAVIH